MKRNKRIPKDMVDKIVREFVTAKNGATVHHIHFIGTSAEGVERWVVVWYGVGGNCNTSTFDLKPTWLPADGDEIENVSSKVW